MAVQWKIDWDDTTLDENGVVELLKIKILDDYEGNEFASGWLCNPAAFDADHPILQAPLASFNETQVVNWARAWMGDDWVAYFAQMATAYRLAVKFNGDYSAENPGPPIPRFEEWMEGAPMPNPSDYNEQQGGPPE